jgi:hypothetical protein
METIVEDKYSIASKSKSNILQVEVYGPFNDKITEKYIDDIYGACDQFLDEPWGLLIAFHGNSVFSPEAEETLIKINKYRVKKGLVANASVLIDSSTADIQQLQLRRIYQACNITFYIFSDINNAKSWLEQYLQCR